jgi:outer membrane immunogenic protein
MKKLFDVAALVLAGSAAVSAAASAAPANRAPHEIVAPVNWTGFYFGGDIGGVSQHHHGTSNFIQSDGPANLILDSNIQGFSPSTTSAIGGIHAGFNWQFTPSLLIGIEGDWQPAHSQDSFCRQTDLASSACFDSGRGFATISSETHLIGTARGRLGWAFEQTMIYGTGGAAFGEVKTSLGLSCLIAGCGANGGPIATATESSSHRTGWVAGAGIERMFGQNWIIRAEYLHVNLGNVSNTLSLPPSSCGIPPCALTWSRSTAAVNIGFINTRHTPMFAWSLHQKNRLRSMVGIQITSPIRGTTLTWPCSAFTTTGNLCTLTII